MSVSTIAGGFGNIADGIGSAIGGGQVNGASGSNATVPGGISNEANGAGSFAAGTNATADHDGTFVWSDDGGPNLGSTGPDQFLIGAAGGVGINTNTTPQELNLDDGNEDGDVIARFHKSASGTDMVVGIHGSSYGLISVQSNDPLAFRTNGTEKMRLTNSGRLGLGTTGPSAWIHVDRASSTSTPQALFSSTGNASTDYARLRMKTGNANYWDIAANSGLNNVMNFFSTLGGGHDVVRFQGVGDPLVVVAANGAHVTTGGTWTDGSSREFKEDLRPVDTRTVLESVLELPLYRWKYKESDEGDHLGPVAEDFYDAFKLGNDDRYIGGVDGDGVALAAIQGLYELVKEQQAEIERLREIVQQKE